MKLRPGKYLLRPLDPLPRKSELPANKVGFASNENKTDTLPRWQIIAAPEIGERQNGVEFPALFKVGDTVLLMNLITQDGFDLAQLLPGFEEEKVLITDETVILGAIEDKE